MQGWAVLFRPFLPLEDPPVRGIEPIDLVLRERNGWGRYNPPVETVYPKEGEHHTLRATKHAPSETNLRRNLEYMNPEARVLFLRLL